MSRAKRAATIIGLLLSVVASATAHAAKAPKVTLTVPSSADAGKTVSVTYTASGAKPGTRLVLQRRLGTKRIWRTTVRLPRSGSGTSHLPALPLGEYDVRIALLGHHNAVLARQSRRLKVFGQVPFASLFGQQEKIYTYATGAFRYVIDRYSPGDVALQGTVIQVGIDNPCRSVHIDFLPGLGPTDAGDISNIQADASLVQESADFVATSVFGGVVGTLNAQIVPGQGWSMSVSQSRGHLLTWYANGTASCYKAATDNNA